MQEITLPRRRERFFLKEDFNPAAWSGLEPYYRQLNERAIENVDGLKQWLKDWSELDAAFGDYSRWVYVQTTLDTSDEKAKSDLVNVYQEIYPKLSPAGNDLNKKLIDCPFTDQLDQDTHHTYLRKVAKDISLFREENIVLNSKLNVKQSEFGQISGAQSINYKGTEMTMQQAGAYFKSTDRTVREDVFRLVMERRMQDAEKLDTLMTELIQLRHQIALNAGYRNYLEYRFNELGRFDYTAADCVAFHQCVKEIVVPVVQEMSSENLKKLGLDVYRPWDTDASVPGEEPLMPFQSADEIIDKTIACFNKLDPYFAERIAIMRDMKYLDLESRMHKRPGGYNMTMPEIGVPFVFMNSTNSERDLITMVHEGGHAVHTFLAHPLELSAFKNFPSEIAEVASMAMELMSMEHWDVYYTNPDDLRRARKNHLQLLLSLLSSACLGDSFQHWMYENPNHTAAERRAKWSELSRKFSGYKVDWTGLEEFQATGYQRILHFYTVPLYYIEYAFAQLGALAIWKNFKNNPAEAIRQYKEALSLGYTKPIPVFYQTAGARFDFSKPYVADLLNLIQQELRKL